jgi:hypothetical protein
VQEVVSGKGQFVCGAKGCDERAGLCSYEVNFSYREAGKSKQALVKLRVCPGCAFKLNYRKEKQYRKAEQQQQQQQQLSKKRRAGGSEDEGEAARSSKRSSDLRAAEELLSRAAGLAEPSDAALLGQHRSVVPPPARLPLNPDGQEDGGAGGEAGAQQQASVLPADDSIWERKPVTQEAEAAGEEFDQYFDGLFL